MVRLLGTISARKGDFINRFAPGAGIGPYPTACFSLTECLAGDTKISLGLFTLIVFQMAPETFLILSVMVQDVVMGIIVAVIVGILIRSVWRQNKTPAIVVVM